MSQRTAAARGRQRALDRGSAERALEHARTVYNDGHPRRAHALYDGLLARLPAACPPGIRVRGLLGRATTGYELHGDADQALAVLREAHAIAVAARDQTLVAAVGGQIGLLYLRAGRAEEGIAAFDRAMQVSAAADPYDVCVILLNRGVALLERFLIEDARSDFAECVRIAAESGDEVREAAARHNLGYAEFLAGDLPQALQHMAESARITPGGPHPTGMLDEARVLIDAGLTIEADRSLAHVASMFRRQGLTHDLAETVYARAQIALIERRWADARRFARAALGTFRRRGNERWDQRAQLLELSARLGVLTDNRLETEPRTPGRRRQRRTELASIIGQATALADACSAAGRTDTARTATLIAAEALAVGGDSTGQPPLRIPTVQAYDSLTTRLHIRRVRARLAWARGDTRTAARQVDLATADLTDRRRRLASADLRTAVAVHGVALAELDIERATRSGSPMAVLRAVERWRALGAGVRQVQPPPDESAAALATTLRTTVRAQEELADGGGSAEQRAELNDRRADLEGRLRALSWQAVGHDDVEVLVTPADFVAGLRETGQVGVAWFVGGGRLWAVTIRPNRRKVLDLVPLGDLAAVQDARTRVRADLDVLGQDLVPQPIRVVAQASLEHGLHRLDDLLLGPLDLPAGAPAVLLPPGPLTLMPWGLLPSRRGVATTLTPSATRWVGAVAARQQTRVPHVSVLSGPGLVHAQTEAERIAAIWPAAATMTGAASTCAALEQSLATSSLVHVAAHGRHLAQNPLFSSLELADGPLFAYDLDAGVDVSEVIILSACDLGMASVRPGDQALGWTAVLLDKGARSVVSAVGGVNDRVTGDVMGDLHALLRDGLDTAAALAQAQAAARDRGDVAPFACFGAGVSVAR